MDPCSDFQFPGLFSSQSKLPKRMDGIRLTTNTHKIYWYAERGDGGKITIRPLNAEMLPSGVKMPVTVEELQTRYHPEQHVYEQQVLPKIRKLEGILDKGDALRLDNQPAKAACEYRRALSFDEENIRATFGVGLVHLTQGEKDKACAVFKRLLELREAFEPRHKHMFNEFGIGMRKNKLFQEAVEYYGRALELTTDDENLHVNIARPLCEQKKFSACTLHLVQALRLDPGNKAATDFLGWMRCKGLIPLHLQVEADKALAAKPVPKAGAEDDCLVLPDELFQ